MFTFMLGTEKTRTEPAQFAETETILPFVWELGQVPNPAWAAWNAAPSNPCGQGFCLAEQLNVYAYAPANARAVVYVFHGGQGTAQMWITGEEEAALLGDLVRKDYAVVLLESTHRPVISNWFFPDPAYNPPNMGGSVDAWNATVNADEMLVRNVHAALGLDATSKVFLVGFSSGSRFASAMAYNLKLAPPALNDYYYVNPRTDTAGGLDVRAAAVHGNDGVPYYFGNYVWTAGPMPSYPLPYTYTTPTIFNHGVNDPGNPPANIALNVAYLAGLGVEVEDNVTDPVRLRPDRFARVLGVSYAESRAIYAALITSGYVNANGFVQTGAESALVNLPLPAGKLQGVQDQLIVLRAEHHVSSEHHHRTVAFFEAHL